MQSIYYLVFLLSCCTLATSYQSQRDYLKLPLHRTTRFPSLTQALAHDSLRLSSLYSTTNSSSPSAALSAPVVSGASAGAGQYLVDLRIGTPAQRLRLVADTGSDLIWARCSPCRGTTACSPRHHPPGSAFLPRRSASFSPFHCFDHACRLLPRDPASRSCPSTRLHSPCRYRYSYADRSFSAGFFSRESVSLNATASHRLRGLRFGCAFHVSAGPSLRGARGVLGLGRGPISFASQAARHLRLADRFSYCLADYTLDPPPTSYLLIGEAEGNTTSLRFTPLETNPLSPTFYYVRILGAAVDGVALKIDPTVWALDSTTGGGGTIVDSGTTLSFLPAPAYTQILKSMRRRIPRSAAVPGPAGFDLCVNSSARGLTLPRLALTLLGGAELSPPPANYFVDAAEGVRCLALQPVSPGAGFGVIGNLMQQGFLFVFDRAADRIGFSRTGCGAD